MKPPDIEAALLAVLPSPAATRVPATMPDAFTRVSRIGGSRLNLVQTRPTVLVECWALTDLAAQARADAAWQALDAAQHSTRAGVWLAGIDSSEPVEYPDPDAPRHRRYQFTASVTAALSI